MKREGQKKRGREGGGEAGESGREGGKPRRLEEFVQSWCNL